MTDKRPVPENGQVKPGDLLVVAGSIGQVGVQTLLERKREWFLSRFSPGYLEGILQMQEPFVFCREGVLEELAEEFGITGQQKAGEGGILRAIWELSGVYRVGVAFGLRQIPVKQHVIEVCEQCGANPYALWCGNCLLLAVEKGWQLAQRLKEQGMEAEVIGEVQGGIARRICHGEEAVGYLERPREDELYRLLGREGLTEEGQLLTK